MDLKGETVAIPLLNEQNPWLYPKYLSFCSQIRVVLTPQGKLSLQETGTITETTTHQNAELWSSVPGDTPTKHFHLEGSGNIAEERAERL